MKFIKERLGQEKGRAEAMIISAGKNLATARKEAVNILTQAFEREEEALQSVKFFGQDDQQFLTLLKAKLLTLNQMRETWQKELEAVYLATCASQKVKSEKLELTADELRLSRIDPVRKPLPAGAEPWTVLMKLREMNVQVSPFIFQAEFELRNFINGQRSILDIRNAASAEYEPLPLLDVEKYFQALEKAGMVELKKK